MTLMESGGDATSWSWSGPGGFTSILQNPVVSPAVAGVYTVVVTDSNGCESTCMTMVVVNALPAVTGTIMDATCQNTDGAIDITPTGTGPFTYSWSNGASTQDLTGLAPGDFTVTVTDGNGCQIQATFIIAEVGCFFDLALTKELSSAGPFAAGDTVTFTITVINQGTLDATDIEISDYVPMDMTLADGDWNADGTFDLGDLDAGAMTTVDVDLEIDADFQGTELVNFAEISEADNVLGQPDIDLSLIHI